MNETADLLLKHALALEQQANFWEAGEEYKCALLEFNKLSGFIDEKALCKRKIREMNLKRSDDFKEVAVDHQLSPEEIQRIEALINVFTQQENLYDALKLLGTNLNFHPNYQRLLASAQSNMPVSFLIANLSSQDQQGNLQRDGHDASAMSYAQNYEIEQMLTSSLYLNPIMHRLMDTKMNFDNLSGYFRSTRLFSENMLNTFDVGLERFMARDYVSSMHILAPIFEKTFMDLTGLIGDADTVAARVQTGSPDQLWTQDKTLGEDFLKNEKVREIWGEDFCEQISFVMFAPLGYKLRHKIAHGYTAFGEFNFSNNVLILYFFLVIAARVKKTTKEVVPE